MDTSGQSTRLAYHVAAPRIAESQETWGFYAEPFIVGQERLNTEVKTADFTRADRWYVHVLNH